jgi:hypothetical protein
LRNYVWVEHGKEDLKQRAFTGVARDIDAAAMVGDDPVDCVSAGCGDAVSMGLSVCLAPQAFEGHI